MKQIKVEIPPIQVTIADLAYLKSLSGKTTGEQYQCEPGQKIKDKCVFLGLIEMGDIPPCPKAILSFKNMVPRETARAKKAITKKNWHELSDAAYNLRHETEPKSRKGFVLTKYGKELLESGATVTFTKDIKGCL